jgi:hypothetical protein
MEFENFVNVVISRIKREALVWFFLKGFDGCSFFVVAFFLTQKCPIQLLFVECSLGTSM